jgi:serine/threonine protein phosphatase 1
LEQAGFDRECEEHIFVSCGDLFDRGCENKKVYDFVCGLKNKILIMGNHEERLIQVLRSGVISELEVSNGTDATIFEMLGRDVVDEDGRFDTEGHAVKIGELTEFLESMIDYYETENYVFTHGWLPIVFEGRYPKVDENWREASKADWHEARWLEWQQLYGVGALLEGKIIVCGHRPSFLAHVYDHSRSNDCSEPFYGEGMIAIDGGTERTGRINVLVIQC